MRIRTRLRWGMRVHREEAKLPGDELVEQLRVIEGRYVGLTVMSSALDEFTRALRGSINSIASVCMKRK